jgi:hypothetical protein
MKMKPFFKLLVLCMPFTFVFISCTKDMGVSHTSNEEILAKQTIRNVVGSIGEIKPLTNRANLKTSIISLAQLRNIVIQQKNPKTYQTNDAELILDKYLSKSYKDQVVNFKSLTEYEDDEQDGPKPAGYYHVQFYAGSPLNQDLGGFYTLHLYFNTDASGRVIGNPTISYTGFGLFSWQQVNISNISFNTNSLVSTFTISGTNTYGIQVGGMTLGWSAMKDFLVIINLDELSSKLVTLIEQQ